MIGRQEYLMQRLEMLDTNNTYDSNYCERIDRKKWRFSTIPNVISILYDHFKPSSVVDVGCANGLHLRAFKTFIPQHDLLGIEGTTHWAPYIERYFGKNYIIQDLRETIPHIRKFDLVISFEVLEHLEKESAIQAVENIASLGNTLCISANQSRGGFHHLNPRPKKYWIRKFELINFTYCGDEVLSLQSKFSNINCSGWFKTGLMVFRKRKDN